MTTIAFIGLGVMGAPMATNLVRADYDVVGFNRSREPIDQLVEAGGRGAESLADAVSEADVVITMVPDSPDVEDAALGEDGIFASAKPGTLYIDCSTISPEVAARLAEVGARHDIRVVDAPVSGGESGAVEATLSIMVGGEPADVEEARPILEKVGKTVVHVGPHGVRADCQGSQPADRRGDHRTRRRGDRLPRGVRGGH
ncbi:MAG: NAD(P)-binding domain-containing protein [Nocardioidaceae bacterium]